jgi:hypothetical protein
VRFTTTTSRMMSSARACLLALILALLAACSQMSPDAVSDRLDKVLRDGVMLHYMVPLN